MGSNVAGGRKSLYSDNVAGGRDGIAEKKLKESKLEKSDIALGGGEVINRVTCSHMWVKLCFFFCNLLARVYKVRPLCSQGSAFGL
jgi:hypothetical protein